MSAPLLSGRPVEWLCPVEEIRQSIRIGAQVARADVMIAGRGQEDRRSQQRRPQGRRRLIRIVDRPVLFPIFRDPASVINDVASDHHEIGMRLIGLVGHRSLLLRIRAAISENHEAIRLVTWLGRGSRGGEHELSLLAKTVGKLAARLQAREAGAVEPVGSDTRHSNPTQNRGSSLLPGAVAADAVFHVPSRIDIHVVPEHLHASPTARVGRVAPLQVRLDEERADFSRRP